MGSQENAVGKVTMQCQLLGLDRDNMNLLLILEQSSGVRVSNVNVCLSIIM